MKKRKILAGIVLISISVGIVGYAKYGTSLLAKNENMKVIKDTKDIKAIKVAKVKVDRYDNILGVQWVDENNLIISKVNKEQEPIKIDTNTVKASIDVKNIYKYNLNSKSEDLIGNKSENTEYGIVSPDKKHILYTTEYQKESIGYISDINGNVITKISDSDIDSYDFENASWINDNQIIIPCPSIGGFVIINTDGNIEKLKDIEKVDNTEGVDALSIIKPVKVGDKIYYTKIHRGEEENNKLMVYDIKTKSKHMLIKDDVLDFKLSSNKDQLAAVVYNEHKNINELTIMKLDGTNRKIVDEGTITSIDRSKNQEEIAYSLYGDDESGVYIVNINTGEKRLVIEGESYYNIEYSPSGEKLMVNATKDVVNEKTNKNDKLFPEQISFMNIVSFK